MPPVDIRKRDRVVVAQARERHLAPVSCRQRVPLVARHLARLAADADRRVGVEADRLCHLVSPSGRYQISPSIAREADRGVLQPVGLRFQGNRSRPSGAALDDHLAEAIVGAALLGLERLVAGGVAIAYRDDLARALDLELDEVITPRNEGTPARCLIAIEGVFRDVSLGGLLARGRGHDTPPLGPGLGS